MASRFYLLFLIASFLLTLSISLYVVGKRVDSSLFEVIQDHTKTEATLTTSNIQQFINTRVQLVQDIAQQPLVISTVMGASHSKGMLTDYLNELRILGKQESIVLFDIYGEVVFNNLSAESALMLSQSKWFEPLAENQSDNAIFLFESEKNVHMGIAIPARYNNLSEGILVVIFDKFVDEAISPEGSLHNHSAVVVNGPFIQYESTTLSKNYLHVRQNHLEHLDLKINYLVDQETVEHEKQHVLIDVATAIITGLTLSFLLLTLLGRQLILAPFKKLEESRKQTAVALKDLENFKYAVDQHNLISITDTQGHLRHVNQKFAETSGYGYNELKGQHHQILSSGLHSRDFFIDIYKLLESGNVWQGEISNRTKGGRIYWLNVTIVPLLNAEKEIENYISIYTDVSALKLAQDEIKNNNLRMHLATNAAEIGIWERDLVKDTLVWDDWMYALYGLSESDVAGAPNVWESRIHHDDLSRVKEAFNDALENNVPYEPSFRVIIPGGEIRNIKAKAQVFRDEYNQPVKMIGVNYDITERIKSVKLLEEARDQAQQAAQAKSEFLANMSHELRTPMNGVIGMLGLLKSDTLSADQARKIDVAEGSAKSLLVLLNDILDLSKVEAGKLELEAIPFDLRKLLADTIETMSHQLPNPKAVQLLLDMSDVEHSQVIGDPGRTRQILTNLIGNAIKFTNQGEILLTASLVSSSTNNPEDDGWTLKCSVKDTGIGIPDEKLHSLFEQFSQVDASTTRKYGGTGLGLSITKHLCSMMNGSISVDSKPGQGSCFSFEVSLGKQNTQALAIPELDIHNKRILIVDASETSRKILAKPLQNRGAIVYEAHSGSEALSLCQQTLNDHPDQVFDAILIDQQMRGMSGKELGSRLRENANFDHAKLIMLASIGFRGDAREFADIGFQAYLQKPVTPDTLLDSLKSILEDGEAAEQASPLVTGHYINSLESSSTSPQTSQQASAENEARPNAKVLLVEDNKVNQMVAEAMLSHQNLEIVCVENGLEALDALSASRSDTEFKLVLMDCQMPEMDGYEATQQIRLGSAGEHYRTVPIIAMTANAMRGDRERCLEVGMNDYISKPIERDTLHEVMAKWLASS